MKPAPKLDDIGARAKALELFASSKTKDVPSPTVPEKPAAQPRWRIERDANTTSWWWVTNGAERRGPFTHDDAENERDRLTWPERFAR